MQLTCPNCGARYRIDASGWPTEQGAEGEPLFRPRRARCKVCRSVWAATPEEEVMELDDPLPPDEEHPRLADAAWAGVTGWPDPRPLPPPPAPDFAPALDRPPPVFTPAGFTPPRDPAGAIFQPPARPAIHFEAPPVPLPAHDRSAVRSRLPGPGALQPAAPPPVAPAPPPPAEGIVEQGAEAEEWEEDRPRPRWPWLLALLLLAVVAVLTLAATGRIRPEDYGLRPFDPAAIGLDRIAIPGVSLPAVSLPRAAVPPLAVEAEVLRRPLPGGRQVWEITGTITNPTTRPQAVPPVELVLLDSRGAEVAGWTVRPEAERVGAGQAVRFETSAIDPPARAERLRMQLKPAELGRL